MSSGTRSALLARLDLVVRWLLRGGLCIKDELQQGANDETRGKMGGEVVMKEELASHEIEREVMGGPR